MLFLRVWRMQCRRVLQAPALWLTALIFAAVLFMNSFGHIQRGGENFLSIIYIFSVSSLQIQVLVFGVLPLLPFSMSYLQEKKERSIRFQAVRSGLSVYGTAKYLAVLFSGFCAVVLGYTFFGLALSLKLPFYLPTDQSGGGSTIDLWLSAGRPVIFVLGYVYSHALAGTLFTGFGFLFSTMTNDRFAAIITPYLGYMLLSLLSSFLKIPYPYSLAAWVFYSPVTSTPIVSLLLKTLAIGLVLLAVGVWANRRIQRRMLHE